MHCLCNFCRLLAAGQPGYCIAGPVVISIASTRHTLKRRVSRSKVASQRDEDLRAVVLVDRDIGGVVEVGKLGRKLPIVREREREPYGRAVLLVLACKQKGGIDAAVLAPLGGH